MLRPFKITFKTNDNEVVATTNIAANSEIFAGAAGDANPDIAGIVGFSLDFFQGSILLNYSLAENFTDKFSSSNYGLISTKNIFD
jgi:hypothetical protein